MEQEDLAAQHQNSLLAEKQSLEEQQKKRKSVLVELNASVSSEQAKLSNLEQDETELKELIKNIREALVNIPSTDLGQGFGNLKGKLNWPVIGKPNNQNDLTL